jgi:hypothetical protein
MSIINKIFNSDKDELSGNEKKRTGWEEGYYQGL